MITAKSLLSAIEARRTELGSDSTPIPYTEAAKAIGVHSAIFSRLKRNLMPSTESLAKIADWVGDEAKLHCETCEQFDTDTDDGDDSARGGAIVALLPAETDPIFKASSEEPSAHMTTIWMGESTDLSDPAAIIEEVKLLAAEFAPFTAKAKSRGELGDDGADVIFLEPDQAAFDIREALLDEDTAVRAAHDSVDQYPDWTPHVTLGYADSPARADYEVGDDTTVTFDRIAVWLADEYHTFDLGAGEKKVRAAFARGKLSTSEDPDTQASINRAKELLAEGAIGVSVALDLHPDDAETLAAAEKTAEADGWEKPFEQYLPEGFRPRERIRHTAMVGTPAFADARLELLEDGVTVEGIVTFEGEWTGDLRLTDLIDLESSRVPSPILYNRESEGHEGPTIGFLESFEWVERPASSHRAQLNDEVITASMKPMQFPSAYFAQTAPTGAEPLRISAPDAQGFRAIRGLAAPKGVCHRSSMSCWTWPGDMDSQHRHFHTGTLIGLDNGKDIRVGALTFGGAHLDPVLAKQGVSASSAASHREDANRVFALVRVWETRYGLMMAGVVPPDVTAGDVTRALACSPSIEFWPERGSRTLVGLHLVPTPALPVLASMGEAEIVVTDERIEVEEPVELEAEEVEVTEEPFDLGKRFDEVLAELSAVHEKLASIESTAGAILALTPIDEIEIPE